MLLQFGRCGVLGILLSRTICDNGSDRNALSTGVLMIFRSGIRQAFDQPDRSLAGQHGDLRQASQYRHAASLQLMSAARSRMIQGWRVKRCGCLQPVRASLLEPRAQRVAEHIHKRHTAENDQQHRRDLGIVEQPQ